MKKRFHILIIIGILIIGFIIGSFKDLAIAETLFTQNNGFGLFMASFGVYPCYAGLSFVGGGLLCTSLRRKDLPMWAKIMGYVLSVAAYGMAIYLCGKEWPSVNGHNVPHLAWLSYLICAIVFAGTFCLGYLICMKGNQKQLWGVLLVMACIFVVSLLPAGYVIKLFIHRPRYRYVVRTGLVDYYNWWQLLPKSGMVMSTETNPIFIDGVEILKEEYKSFPSGHSGTGMILAMFLPFASYFFPKLKGKETLLFYIGAAYGFLMMFSRLLVGAHYLTDTCMGALLVMIVFYVVNEFAYRKGLLDDPKPEEAAPQAE